MKTKSNGARTGTVLASLGVVAMVLGTAAPAQAEVFRDPLSSGCARDAYTVDAWGVYNSKYGQYQGTVELRYSPKCGTNWVRMSSNTPGNRVYAGIQALPAGGGNTADGAAYDVSTSWSGMVNAPGSTCVNVYAYIVDNKTQQTEGKLPIQTRC